MKLKKNDIVVISTGKDKGKQGKIEKIFPKSGTILLPGLNQFKRHEKKRDEKRKGGIITFDRPVKIANVALICPACKKPTRVGYKVAGGEKMRMCRKCGKTL